MGTLASDDPSLTVTYTNAFLGQLLTTLRLMAGSVYPQILEEAGLIDYQDHPSPADQARAATINDIAGLCNRAHSYLAPPQAMLFSLTTGERQALEAWECPEMQALAQELALLPATEQVAAAWERINAVRPPQIGGVSYVLPDERSDYLVWEQCCYCSDQRKVDQPVCLAVVRYYEVLLQKLLGRAMVVREVECTATGQGRCVFAVRRERQIAPRL